MSNPGVQRGEQLGVNRGPGVYAGNLEKTCEVIFFLLFGEKPGFFVETELSEKNRILENIEVSAHVPKGLSQCAGEGAAPAL